MREPAPLRWHGSVTPCYLFPPVEPTKPHDPARERAHFEAVMARRGTLYWADRTAAGRRRQESRAALLMAAVPRADARHVLEIGCGNGEYTRTLSRHTKAILVAIDVTPVLVAAAHADAPANVRVAAADVERLPFASGTFDAVVGNAVLHHLKLERTVPELLRVLKPGGRLSFAEPNMLNPHVFVERNIPFLRRWFDDSPDETAFVRWRLRRTLERFGLGRVDIRPFDFLYPLTPRPLIPAVERIGRVLERLPGVAEIAGSLLVTAQKVA